MKRVAIYTRKSKETDTGESINTQIQMCKDYFIRQKGVYEFEVFQDEGFSGGNTNRPEFQRMMLLSKHGQFDIIACYKVDRIGRNIVDFMNTFSELEKHNITLVSITEGFDPSTAAGRMMMTMIAGFAEMERMNIAQRVKDNMDALAKLGRWNGGTCPTGYKSVRLTNGDKTAMYLELIPEWQSKLQTIFDNVAQGLTCFQVAKIVNMSPKTIANIVNNPVYCKADEESNNYLKSIGYTIYGHINGNGYIPYNRRPRLKNGKKLFNADGMYAATSIHKAPISAPIWIKANQNIKARGKDKRPRTSEFTWLAHIVKCTCGTTMYVQGGHYRKDNTRICYLRCKNCNIKWINIADAENDILEILTNLSNDSLTLKSHINFDSSFNYDDEIKSLKLQLKNNINAINKLADKIIILEDVAVEIVTKKMNSLSQENDELSNKLLILQREKILNNKENTFDILSDNLNKFINFFPHLSMEEKQIAIQSIVSTIDWDGTQLNIHLLQ